MRECCCAKAMLRQNELANAIANRQINVIEQFTLETNDKKLQRMRKISAHNNNSDWIREVCKNL